MSPRRRLTTLILFLLLSPLSSVSSALAATLSGTVRNEAGAGLGSIEISLWTENADQKRWESVTSTTTASGGTWSLTSVATGEYRVHARMAPGLDGNYADRWYVDPPGTGGFVAADATVLTVSGGDTVSGLDVTLPVVGGLEGRVLDQAGSPLQGMQVRVERAGDPRLHHNDWTDPPCCTGNAHWGYYYMRGLPPASDYRVLVHDPTGVRGTRIATGPYPVNAGANGTVPDITFAPLAADPYEPNNSAGAAGAESVDSANLHADPPVTWRSSGAWVGPRGSDVDYHCFDVGLGDRLLLTVENAIDPGGVNRDSPFVDPMLWLVDAATGTVIAADDDSGPGAFESFVDTGLVGGNGHWCAVVSTFGDTDRSGAGQQSGGQYRLEVAMGNRHPDLDVTILRDDVPIAGPTFEADEGQLIVLTLSWSDPDHDALDLALDHRDSTGGAILLPTFVLGAGSGSYTWQLSETAAEQSPFTLSVSATDGEFTAEVDLVALITSVNRAPSRPVLVLPDDGITVRAARPTLVVSNSVDPDGDALQYDFEVYYDGLQAEPDQTIRIAEGDNEETSWTIEAVPDDTVVTWRVRAYDGNTESAYSAWTEPWTFLVDAANSPPSAPILLKPDDGEELGLRTPACSAQNAVDPEGDAVSITFEVARDADFTDLVTTSEPVAQSSLSSTTQWSLDTPLEWGRTYYARARAEDNLGATSDYSNVNVFHLKPNDVAGAPSVGAPFLDQCAGHLFGQTPPTEVVVAKVSDPEGEPITFDLEIHAFDADPNAAEPVYAISVPQDEQSDATVLPIDAEAIAAAGHYRLRVRAFDGTDYTEWSECDFFVAEPPPDAVPLVILRPEEGFVFDRDTTVVEVEVQNAFDPGVSAATGMEVAYCLSPDPNYSRCNADPAGWAAVAQTSMEPTETTVFTVSGFDEGQNWWLRACARRPDGSCGPADSTQFSIQQPEKVVTPGCSCRTSPAEALPLWAAFLVLLVPARRRSSRPRLARDP